MKKKRNNGIINLFILVLFFISIFLGYKINEKKKFFDLPPIHTWIPYENWFKSNDDFVSTFLLKIIPSISKINIKLTRTI